MITHAGCWKNTRKAWKSQAKASLHAGKPIESVVYCFQYKITLSKTENVSVFCEFTGTINHGFLTNQNARTILEGVYMYMRKLAPAEIHAGMTF